MVHKFPGPCSHFFNVIASVYLNYYNYAGQIIAQGQIRMLCETVRVVAKYNFQHVAVARSMRTR
jgi:hypothetical protein